MKIIDMHMHSIYSDGQFEPSKLIELAKNNNVETISITDHDDIRSALEINSMNNLNINYINGVELSSITKIGERNQVLHILGYGYDINNKKINKILEEKRNLRNQVNIEYLYSLIKNFDFIKEDIVEKVVCDKFIRLSRLIIKYLEEEKYKIDQINQVNLFMKKNNPIYNNYEFTDKEAINLILEADGYPVLAHPYQYRLTYEEEDELIKKLISYGLVGIEKNHSGDSEKGMKLQEEFVNKYNLYYTIGSDFHTDYDDFGNQIGLGKNNNLCKSDCSLLKQLKLTNKIQRK